MGLFGGESKEEKQARKEQEMLAKFGLEELSNPQDIASMKNIVKELAGTGLIETGVSLGGGTERDIQKLQMFYLRAILEQNFIMIRQLDRITKNTQ